MNGVYGRSGGSGTRISSYKWDSGSSTAESTTGTFTTATVTMSPTHHVNTVTVTQYQVTLDSGATSALNSLTTPAVSGDNYWYDSATSATLILNGVYGRGSGTGTRVTGYRINSGSNNSETTAGTFTVLSALSISSAQSIATTTVSQYQVSLDSGATAALSSITAPTVSGDAGWYDSGVKAHAGLDVGTVGTSGTQYVFTSWGTDASSNNYAQSDDITMSGPKTATAGWQTQYYLTVTSAYGSPTGEGWYNADASASFGVTTPASGGTGVQYVLTSWSSSDSGGYNGSLASTSVTMDNPIAETAT